MQVDIGRRLLTCRYWAFCKACPDDDSACPYAHWDTGRLSNFLEQRGTCWHWLHRNRCRYGSACNYEHRVTGLTVKDGRINLQVADVAFRSGFNTFDTEALMDLIWAVRRVTFVHGVQNIGHRRERPPRHKIYPDVYRPSDPLANERIAYKRARDNDTHSQKGPRVPIEHEAEMRSNKRRKTQATGGYSNPIQSPLAKMDFTYATDDHDATVNELRKIDGRIRTTGIDIVGCMESLKRLWEGDRRLADQRIQETGWRLKANLDGAQRATESAMKDLLEIEEVIQEANEV